MSDMTNTPQAGHNGPPPYDPAEVERLTQEGVKFLEAAAQWLENGDLTSEEDAQRLNDFMNGVSARAKIAESARVKAKKPHDDAGVLVQKAFKPIIEKMGLAKTKVQPLLTKWLQVKEAERQAEVRRQQEEARRAQEDANRLAAAAASRHDISGEVDAEAARKAADQAAKDAEKLSKAKSNVSSATGGGRTASLRTAIEVGVTNARVLFLRYQDHPDMIECLRNLAAREARQASFNIETDEIPGAKITRTQKAV